MSNIICSLYFQYSLIFSTERNTFHHIVLFFQTSVKHRQNYCDDKKDNSRGNNMRNDENIEFL